MGRYFWGIGLPEEIGARIEAWAADQGAAIPVKRWYHRGQFHITLLFFGDLIDDKLDSADGAARETAKKTAPFDLVLGSLGTFNRSKVVWLGIRPNPNLMALRQSLWEAATALGASGNDRPAYRPHLTLGRLSLPWEPAGSRAPDTEELAGISFRVSEFHRYESRLSPAGPEYRAVSSFGFQADQND
ncbi:RNA 2',3'-cyclic phosphodiesterase [Kyrpidia sp.]|uniref:RNA 2',3'-cyclic phosphodiesterase n=1 Tax=Kyrpidia sp. TaxID=2073077 RepID=UPI002585B32D|nr:RNA 2',3'-cyclic phosphodiesterase [Kyrpidia sp.]MCL6577722.1 RNA 2',3'-cyclic phosphodiesterase [Kyrpidia sp.]